MASTDNSESHKTETRGEKTNLQNQRDGLVVAKLPIFLFIFALNITLVLRFLAFGQGSASSILFMAYFSCFALDQTPD
jgi:hypothetical protein